MNFETIVPKMLHMQYELIWVCGFKEVIKGLTAYMVIVAIKEDSSGQYLQFESFCHNYTLQAVGLNQPCSFSEDVQMC